VSRHIRRTVIIRGRGCSRHDDNNEDESPDHPQRTSPRIESQSDDDREYYSGRNE
jgi:hypothetical protein